MSVWLSVDPLSDERLWVSPYNYVQWNPLNRIDPTGMLDNVDNYKVDLEGNVTLIEKTDDDFDVLYNHDESGAIQVEKGVLDNIYTQTGDDSSGPPFEFDVIKARGDEQGKSIFKFLANNTNVEWSHFQMGEEGKNGLNYIMTSHDEGTERSAYYMLRKQLQYKYTIRSHTHNHPSGIPIPSGLIKRNKDIGLATLIENWYTKKYPQRSNKPLFYIYTTKHGKVQYDKNSKPGDFIEYMMPTIHLEEIIIE